MQGKIAYKPLTIPKFSWGKSEESQVPNELIVQPLEPGYGVTLGNALRRVMLSSVEGSAVTSVIIKGVNNEFSTLKGMHEDVLLVILNIKGIVIKNETGLPGKMHLSVKGKKVVTVADITTDEHLSVINKDHVIANLGPDAELDIEFFVEVGRGYVPAQWPHGVSIQPDGRIYLDAMFSPVRRVEFNVEKTRVGQAIDYDKLVLTITTNGAVNPQDVVHYGTSVLRTQLENFLIAGEIPFNEISKVDGEVVSHKEVHVVEGHGPTGGLPVDLFLKPIDELEFSVRAHNCLVGAGIKRVIDLVNLTEEEILKIKNFGRKSLREVKEILVAFGLRLNMNVKELDLKKVLKEQEESMRS